MRIRSQLVAAAVGAAVVAAMVVLGLVHVTRLSAEATRAQAGTQEVARDVTGLLALTLEYTLYGGERPTEQWRTRHAQLTRTVQAALARSEPPLPSLLALQRSVEPLPLLFDRLEEIDLGDADALAQRRKQFLVERLMTEMQEVAEARYRWAAAIGQQQARDQALFTAMTLGAPGLLLMMIVALALLVGRRVLRPLARLQAAADAVRGGDLGVRLGSDRADELGEMARAFDAMTLAQQQHTSALENANGLLEQEVLRRQDSEQTLRAVTDNVPAFMARVDAGLRYRFVNAAMARAFGGEQALLGRSIREVRGEAAWQQLAPHAECALTGEATTFEFHDDAPGHTGWYQSSYIPELDADGRPCGFFINTFDVTERRRAALQLAASEERLKLVMDNVPALIGYIDAERRYRLVNRGYENWHGAEAGTILGRRVDEFYNAEQRSLYGPAMDRAFAGETVSYDLEVVRQGQPRALRVTYIPQCDAAGAVQGVYILAHDITELRRTEQQLRTIMEASPLGMFISDPQGLCRYVNPAWQRIAGLTLEESLGRGWLRVIHPDDELVLRQRFIESQTTGSAVVTEHRYVQPDGGWRWVRGHAAPLFQGQHLTGHVGTVEDITERRALDAELAERGAELARSNAELEQFAYVASHDLQEPLRMVTSYTQLLVRRHGGKLDGDAQEFLGFIEDGGRRAQALIADLLSLARVNSQGKPFEPVALQAVLDDVSSGLRLLVQDCGAQITHDEPLPTVSADRRQLGQLLQNLLANALKFRGAAQPRVHLGVAREADGRWRISVADNGIGIEPEFHQRVFVMFQRLHLRGEYPGTGIGLAICKKVVERHGGRIGVESQRGQGSTFWFTLAGAQPSPQPSPASGRASKAVHSLAPVGGEGRDEKGAAG